MSVMKVIYLIIAYIILFFFWMIFRWTILPHLRVGVYALPPAEFWVTIWKVLMSIAGTIFNYLCIALVIIWLLYLFIKTFIPNFPIPLKMILLMIPPFPQLEKAGIFDLFSSIAGIIFSFSPFKDRMKRVGQSVGDFIARNLDMTMSMIGLGGVVDKIELATRNGAATPAPPPKRGGSTPPPSKFEKSEDRLADDVYQQCMEENTILLDDTMTQKEQEKAQRKNAALNTMCKVKSLQAYATMLAFNK